MRTLKLTLAYDGTNYCGWQMQPGQPTVQDALERALTRVLRHSVRVVASGRTDSGVHALGQVVSFRTERELPADTLGRALNAELPADIAVMCSEDAADDFHALTQAVSKRYRYVFMDGPLRDVFAGRYAWHTREPLNAEWMETAARGWLGTHDFASFETAGSPRESTVRTVTDIGVRRVSGGAPWPTAIGERIEFEVEADGFLYNMVRAMAGTLHEVGRGAKPLSWAEDALAAADRRAAGPTAPPQGLFLLRVEYPTDDPSPPPAPAINKRAAGG